MAHEHETPQDPVDADHTSQLDVLILLYGTRGDTQPYLRIARLLRETYGHRVRLAAAPTFGPLVSGEYGLEFFSTGHDLAPFLDFDQRTKTLGSKLRAMVNGELDRLKKRQAEIFDSHWLACIDGAEDNKRPFVADAIISTPVAWTPISLAQRLGIPLFLLHANPRSPTRAWPHSARNPSDTVLVECDQNFKSWRAEESKYVGPDSKHATQLKTNPRH
jgi:UDP:flavonoid glycosyltransferase YjiC (YdhE family)